MSGPPSSASCSREKTTLVSDAEKVVILRDEVERLLAKILRMREAHAAEVAGLRSEIAHYQKQLAVLQGLEAGKWSSKGDRALAGKADPGVIDHEQVGGAAPGGVMFLGSINGTSVTSKGPTMCVSEEQTETSTGTSRKRKNAETNCSRTADDDCEQKRKAAKRLKSRSTGEPVHANQNEEPEPGPGGTELPGPAELPGDAELPGGAELRPGPAELPQPAETSGVACGKGSASFAASSTRKSTGVRAARKSTGSAKSQPRSWRTPRDALLPERSQKSKPAAFRKQRVAGVNLSSSAPEKLQRLQQRSCEAAEEKSCEAPRAAAGEAVLQTNSKGGMKAETSKTSDGVVAVPEEAGGGACSRPASEEQLVASTGSGHDIMRSCNIASGTSGAGARQELFSAAFTSLTSRSTGFGAADRAKTRNSDLQKYLLKIGSTSSTSMAGGTCGGGGGELPTCSSANGIDSILKKPNIWDRIAYERAHPEAREPLPERVKTQWDQFPVSYTPKGFWDIGFDKTQK